jgi:SAM-dependent methyltransferase
VALDLGCGAGVEVGELANAGWRVTGIDSSPGTTELVTRELQNHSVFALAKVVVIEQPLAVASRSLPFADLVYSGYALPYVHPADFASVWNAIRGCLRPGGYLAVHLFGDRDSYVGEPDWNFHTEAETRTLFDGLELLKFDIEDQDGMAAGGPKHWHVFHVIARKSIANQ